MSKTLNILNCQGATVGEYIVPDTAIEMSKGGTAVHDAVVAIRAGRRAGTACTKTRGLVRGGGAKPFRQKGRGGARAGSSRSPVWTGGGTIFGPQPRSFAKKVNKKVFTLALKRAFSERLNEDAIVVVDKFDLPDHKTKNAVAILKKLDLYNCLTLLTVPEYENTVVCATGNISSMGIVRSAVIDVYDIMSCDKVLFTKEALDAFIARLA